MLKYVEARLLVVSECKAKEPVGIRSEIADSARIFHSSIAALIAPRPSTGRVLNRTFSVMPGTLGCAQFRQVASVSTKLVRNGLIRVFS